MPDAVVHHVGSATTGKDSDFAVYHGHRNLVWTYVKNMPGPLFWIYLPQHIAANVYIIVRYALKGKRCWRVILKAKWDAIIELCANALRRSTLTPSPSPGGRGAMYSAEMGCLPFPQGSIFEAPG
ncbi:MAG: glycosyltransferase family 2 protein, partial [Burkholderiales bacterium]